MLELRVATACPWVTAVLDGFDDEAQIASTLPIGATPH
jgi:hypothetical protein